MTPVSWRELRGTELEGLLLLRAAREQFRREYRACGECGAAVKGKICPRCGAVKQ
jgi:rubrerythrin